MSSVGDLQPFGQYEWWTTPTAIAIPDRDGGGHAVRVHYRRRGTATTRSFVFTPPSGEHEWLEAVGRAIEEHATR